MFTRGDIVEFDARTITPEGELVPLLLYARFEAYSHRLIDDERVCSLTLLRTNLPLRNTPVAGLRPAR